MRSSRHRRVAFSLVEMVIVVTIIGIIAAIAVPRISGAAYRATANVLLANLSNVRKAVDTYYAEHYRYPGYNPDTGVVDGGKFVEQLMRYSNQQGDTSPSYSSTFRFGPYLREPFPKNPVNQLGTVFMKETPAAPEPVDGSVGWVAVLSHGYFGISATDAKLQLMGITDTKELKLVRVQAQ